ncbi:Kef-type potassium/proton antiporter (CPA2 family) [Aliiruegeria haliotis]|uniref:Kef-type potassium/proton antiporter (CPA2 family) n=1 Tax=Aliiruegeria haliotis TaxID=1280846 RepID=A0A2T0RUV6_9RHOB|nr:cation:proton antiporter [Aliiruegeria haliotis]PRY24979.1 Kef-type potassium/proton antiporter (CPA2 family) [Aliiruegeria haliotis]
MEGFFDDATILLGAAVIGVPIAARLGLGSVLGYLLAGIAIGPLLTLVGVEPETLRHYAEFGVVMMLFLIGLELEPRTLWAMRHTLIGLGGMQIALTVAVVTALSYLMGESLNMSIAIGMILALSSTAIVLQTLSEKGLMKTPGGKATFSVLLTQDIAVIPMLALMPLLAMPAVPQLDPSGIILRAGEAAAHADEHGHGAHFSLIEGLAGWQATMVIVTVIVTVILAGMYLSPLLFRYAHMAKLREIHTATALLVLFGIAYLMVLIGLSPALGAFLGGVVLASSEFRHELESNIEPFKGLLLGVFFMSVGAGIDFRVMFDDAANILGLTALLVFVKAGILLFLTRLFGLHKRDKWLFTLGLAQAGEFGFVLISFSLQENVLPERLAQTLLLVVALSMLITPLLFILYDWISHHLGEHTEATDVHRKHDEIDEDAPVIIAGIGRFGQVVNRMVEMAGLKCTVLDHDLAAIELMRHFGFKAFYGDPTRPVLLHAAGLKTARVLVACLDDKHASTRLVRYARSQRPDLHIVARAHDRVHVYELYQAGADDIVREMFDSSLRAARYVLENMDFSEFEANEMERTFYKHDRMTLRELAPLWEPGRALKDNPAYLARARELNKELETALVAAVVDEEAEDKATETRPKTVE